jgi:hypothetical protein
MSSLLIFPYTFGSERPLVPLPRTGVSEPSASIVRTIQRHGERLFQALLDNMQYRVKQSFTMSLWFEQWRHSVLTPPSEEEGTRGLSTPESVESSITVGQHVQLATYCVCSRSCLWCLSICSRSCAGSWKNVL